jgi:hypothetical protein
MLEKGVQSVQVVLRCSRVRVVYHDVTALAVDAALTRLVRIGVARLGDCQQRIHTGA